MTTILAADLAGFSRLMAADEEGVIKRLRAARKEIIDPGIATCDGRIIKTMGDGLLVEFASPVQALRAALGIQRDMHAREAREIEASRLRFRIGINLGDVVIDGEDVLGDAVNIAARLESLAPVGGICISRAVFDQAKGRIDAEMTTLGPQAVKNMPEPVDVWRVEVEGAEAAKPVQGAAERPSIAVLPFANMSADQDQEFLADGIVEDVITELSRFRSLLVIARNSTFAYKGASQDVRRISKELGARYLVEGSVRRSGNRLRVTAQLIEASSGTHVWAGKWDRTLEDIFDLQDELTHAIVTAVEPELGAHERRLARARPTDNLTSWELCQRSWPKLAEYNPRSLDEAEALLRASAKTDPNFALPRALLARVANVRVAIGLPDPSTAIAKGFVWAREALAIDDRLEIAHGNLAVLLAMSGQAEAASDSAATALALNPNNAFCHHAAALAEMFKTQPDTAKMVAGGETAMRLSPKDPTAHAFQNVVTIAHLIEHLDHGHLAYQVSARAAARLPGAPWYVHLQAATVEIAVGDTDAARKHLRTALTLSPRLTMASYRHAFQFPAAEKLFALGDRSGTTEALIELGLPRQ
ncbi:adenylate/guanylate cyclase domain-containing protein [Sulfitobacter sp. JB4-11]|uniref:adenylate/guanylate cyclase domain-containing protein n=1 Tax=Sulfitobacter rhodophyticola TaxID=3238304 RepID=UPI003D81B401